jgi:hypothetical protein
LATAERNDQVPATRTERRRGNGQGTKAKYLRGAAGIGLGTSIKYLRGAADTELGNTITFFFVSERRRGQRSWHHDQVP